MRDPARINRILGKLRAYWLTYPDLRLGQIVSNAAQDARQVQFPPRPLPPHFVFYADDADIEAWLTGAEPVRRADQCDKEGQE